MRFLSLIISRPMSTIRLSGIALIDYKRPFSEAGTSHGVNGIAVQARDFGPSLSPSAGIEQARTRERSIDPSVISVVPPYNAGNRCGRRARTFV